MTVQTAGRGQGILCVLPEIQTGPTAAQTGSRRILDLSWALTGAALKLPWSCSPGLNVDPPLVDGLRNSAVFDILLHPQPVCKHHNTEILKMKSTTKASSAVFQRRVSASPNPSASSSCQCRSPSLFFTLLPCARQYCTRNGWLVSNIWPVLLEPKLWEIVLLAAPDALS